MKSKRLDNAVSRVITLIQQAKKGQAIHSSQVSWGKNEQNCASLEVQEDGALFLNQSRIGNVSDIKWRLHGDSDEAKLLIKGLLTEDSEYWSVYAQLIKVMEDGKGDISKLERLIRNIIKSYPYEISRLIRFLHTQGRTDEVVELAKTKMEEYIYNNDPIGWRKINDCLPDIVGSEKYEEILDKVFQKPEVEEKYRERVNKYF